jgi:hypothetical protein
MPWAAFKRKNFSAPARKTEVYPENRNFPGSGARNSGLYLFGSLAYRVMSLLAAKNFERAFEGPFVVSAASSAITQLARAPA